MGILDIPAELLQSIFILITPDAHVLVSRKKDPDQRQDFCEADVLNRSEWRKLLNIRYTCRGFRSNLDRALDSAKKTGDSRLIMELVEHKECPSIREEGKRSGNHDSSMAFITSFCFLRVSCPHLIRVSKPGEEAYAEESLELFTADFALPAVVHLPTSSSSHLISISHTTLCRRPDTANRPAFIHAVGGIIRGIMNPRLVFPTFRTPYLTPVTAEGLSLMACLFTTRASQLIELEYTNDEEEAVVIRLPGHAAAVERLRLCEEAAPLRLTATETGVDGRFGLSGDRIGP
ncbi:unnamed protein product [Zymoseptoria tritici ST99CH_1A5]|uniref:Uncharacterized protein n=1 Tax=Zymoseptoria tritici ST99CH_1A5 TaxID=1276529 RepID=A0A1Y6LQE9_ZYMTR|nr:unnamed protein product [Zymoseptoria tritici ST99CH_1A5]